MLISDIPALFKQGRALTNPSLWANSTALAGTLTGFLVAAIHISKLVGFDFGVQDDTVKQAAGGIAALALIVTSVLHVLANKNAGLPPPAGTGPAVGTDAGPGAGPG